VLTSSVKRSTEPVLASVACAVLIACTRNATVEAPVIGADASAAEIALIAGDGGGAPVPVAATGDTPFRQGDRLTGEYTCNQGRTAATLIIESVERNDLEAVFEFSFPGSPIQAGGGREFDPAEGSFRMHGTWESRTRRLRFLHKDWINMPPRYQMIDLDGRVEKDRSPATKYAGKIEAFKGCTTFELVFGGP